MLKKELILITVDSETEVIEHGTDGLCFRVHVPLLVEFGAVRHSQGNFGSLSGAAIFNFKNFGIWKTNGDYLALNTRQSTKTQQTFKT